MRVLKSFVRGTNPNPNWELTLFNAAISPWGNTSRGSLAHVLVPSKHTIEAKKREPHQEETGASVASTSAYQRRW